jgi:hypothetical protein
MHLGIALVLVGLFAFATVPALAHEPIAGAAPGRRRSCVGF